MNTLIMESNKTIQMKIMDANFDLVEIMKKYANGMDCVSSVVFDNGRIIPARKLQPMLVCLSPRKHWFEVSSKYNIQNKSSVSI